MPWAWLVEPKCVARPRLANRLLALRGDAHLQNCKIGKRCRLPEALHGTCTCSWQLSWWLSQTVQQQWITRLADDTARRLSKPCEADRRAQDSSRYHREWTAARLWLGSSSVAARELSTKEDASLTISADKSTGSRGDLLDDKYKFLSTSHNYSTWFSRDDARAPSPQGFSFVSCWRPRLARHGTLEACARFRAQASRGASGHRGS